MPNDDHAEVGRLDPESALAEVERLLTDRPHREARRAFFAEGVRNLIHAIETGSRIETILSSERLLAVHSGRRLVGEQRRAGVPTIDLTPEQFRRISRTPRASGVGAIVAQRWSRLHCVSPRAGLCWIVLETIRSEGNLGTLIRTSEAVGGAGFILVGDRIDPYDPGVVRASMGAIFRQAFVRTTYASLRQWLRRHRCRVVGASPEAPADFHRFDFPRPTILLLGEERQGLNPLQRELCPSLVRIPMTGAADSLNVAVAGSLLLYEVYRSRSLRGSPTSRVRAPPPYTSRRLPDARTPRAESTAPSSE